MKARMIAVSVTATAAAVLATVSPAASAASPWQPAPSSDFTQQPGVTCDFTLNGHVVADQVKYRTTSTYPDGSTRTEEYTGKLVVRYTNLDTGASVTRNLTGAAIAEYYPDGSFSLTDVSGHLGVGLHEGDTPQRGFFVVDGQGWKVTFGADGHRTLTPGQGTIENLCETLV